jgi:hypothetical protein
MRTPRLPPALLAAVAVAAMRPAPARAEGLTATVEPTYSHVETEITDQSGTTTHETVDTLGQRYRLSFDRRLTDALAASVGGTLTDDRGWRRTNGVSSDAHARDTLLFGRLNLGTPVLTAGLGVDRREERQLSPTSSGRVVESAIADVAWRPLDLPDLQLRLAHVNAFDPERAGLGATSDSAQISMRHRTTRWDVSYLLGWNRSIDREHASETTGVDQTALATRTDSLFGGRTTTYLSGTVQTRNSSTSGRGPDATVARPQLPIAGLSTVVTGAATVDNVQLLVNAALIDGNTTDSAGVNVGFGVSPPERRDVAGRFADVVTEVNTIHVWLDRSLSPEVGSALAAAAQVFQSDDNQRWTPLALAAPPVVAQFDNRLEMTLPQTAARFLKVSLAPLPAGLTVDAAFRDIFVTEIQFFLVVPIERVSPTASTARISATANAKTTFLKKPELAHDLSATVSRQTDPAVTAYAVVNGLSGTHKLMRWLTASARAARQDLDDGREHEGSWLWNASLTGTPIPTLFWTLTYNGSATDEDLTTHAFGAFARADWYEGVSTQGNVSGAVSAQELRVSRTFQASGSTSITPNSWLTVTAGGLYSRTLDSDADLGDTLTQFGRVDGSVSLTPAPALSATGTVTRVLIGERPTTLATVQVNYFPLRGEVQVAVAYSKTLDTEAETTTEFLTPSLRWNIRSGISLTASYTALENVTPVQDLSSRALTANLLIIL